MSDQGRYLFAVTEGLEPGDLEGQEGLAGQPLRLVTHGRLQAVVCDVPLDEFGEEPVRRHLEDLGWLEKVARTHDSVVRAVGARATVAPMRLVTLCLDDDSVVDRLRQWQAPLEAALDRVRGCREWSVKVFATVRDEAAAAEGPAASGRAYLERKRAEAERRHVSARELDDMAEAVYVALAGRARAGRRLMAQDPQLTGRGEPMILNGAFLVSIEDEQAFLDAVDDVSARYADAELELAGPWAPYSFAVLEQVDDG
jgi:hypothetical protein